MRQVFIIILILASNIASAQKNEKPQIIAGPMNGYAEHTEALVWVQTKCAKQISLKYWPKGASGNALVQTMKNEYSIALYQFFLMFLL